MNSNDEDFTRKRFCGWFKSQEWSRTVLMFKWFLSSTSGIPASCLFEDMIDPILQRFTIQESSAPHIIQLQQPALGAAFACDNMASGSSGPKWSHMECIVCIPCIDKSIDSLKTLEMTMGNTWDFDQNLGVIQLIQYPSRFGLWDSDQTQNQLFWILTYTAYFSLSTFQFSLFKQTQSNHFS